MISIILLIIIGLLVAWFVGIYNKLVNLKALVDEAWSGIDVQLKRRYDLIPNLVETVKGYSTHEKTTLENIAKFRSLAMSANTVEDKVKAETGLTGALKTLFAVAENYPELKANENFMSLQHQLANIETELQLARRYYNGSARNYNISVTSVPSNLVANMSGFSKAPYFELTSAEEKETPKVKF